MKVKLLILCIGTIFLNACVDSDDQGFQGYVEGENIYLASPYSGKLTYIAVSRGQRVSKGQLLYELDKDPQALHVAQYTADLNQANHILNDLKNPLRKPEIAAIKAQIEQTNARMQLIKARVLRNRMLYLKKFIAKDSLDATEAALKEQQKIKVQYESNLQLAFLGRRKERIAAQQAEVMSINAKLADAKWQLAQKQVYAPTNGIIFDTYYQQGEFVGSQQSVLSLLAPANIRIEFFIPVRSLNHIKIGQKVTFKCDECLKTSYATISYISPEAQYIPPLVYGVENSDKLVFRVKAQIADFNQYKPGQPVMVYGIGHD